MNQILERSVIMCPHGKSYKNKKFKNLLRCKSNWIFLDRHVYLDLLAKKKKIKENPRKERVSHF